MAEQKAGKAREHMARITVTDQVWGEFREAAHARGISVTTYLAQLVSKEVTHLRADAAKADSLTSRHAAAALADARSLRDDLAAITRRLEYLTSRPEPMGGTPSTTTMTATSTGREPRYQLASANPAPPAEPRAEDWMMRKP